MRPSSSPPEYPRGFLARYLRPLVQEARSKRGCRQQDVAEWLGIPAQALSEYLTGRSHPSPARQEGLLRLGCDVRDLRHAMLADKVGGWVDKTGITAEDLRDALRQIDAALATERSNNST